MSDLCYCLQKEKSWKQVWKENCIICHQSKVFNCLLCFFPKFATTPLSSRQDNTRLYPFLLSQHRFQNLRNAVDRNWEIKFSESKKYTWQYNTAFQYNHSFGFQKPMKVKVVKWGWKKWKGHDLMHICHKQCEIIQKIAWNSSNGQIHCFHYLR